MVYLFLIYFTKPFYYTFYIFKSYIFFSIYSSHIHPRRCIQNLSLKLAKSFFILFHSTKVYDALVTTGILVFSSN